MEYEGDNYTNLVGAFGTVSTGLLTGVEDFEVGENGQNTEKSVRDWGYLLSLKLHWKIISWHWCERF